MKLCDECREAFSPKRAEQVYCSKNCASVKKGKKRLGQKTGPQWWRQYRKSEDRDGYIRVYSGKHPYRRGRKMILEHVMVMEAAIGRPLRPDECVHHLDGDRKNNALENLQLMTRSEHSKLHGAEIARKRTRDEVGRFV